MTPAAQEMVGEAFTVPYPFIREEITLWDEDGATDVMSWRPGVRSVLVYPDDSESVADGIGFQTLTVIATFSPKPYPTRIFYTRRWRDPDGKEFGKNRLHIATKQQFTRLVSGYRHKYRLAEREVR